MQELIKVWQIFARNGFAAVLETGLKRDRALVSVKPTLKRSSYFASFHT